MTHPDLDTKRSRMPFDRYPVVGYCLQATRILKPGDEPVMWLPPL